jgi:hypothetical protein
MIVNPISLAVICYIRQGIIARGYFQYGLGHLTRGEGRREKTKRGAPKKSKIESGVYLADDK